ncbi:hypothetical protein QBC39DRAFT_58526 [Podospora conica]|nr:hypothetical protein QBC39DRAFT_58526 [Schizothecium conicum]
MEEWNRKRVRDDEYADIAAGGTLGFTEHRSKRIQALPVRTSPNSKQWATRPDFPPANPTFANPVAPRVITPGDSEEEEVRPQPAQTWADEPELVSQMGDCDMDMGDMHPDEPCHNQLEPGPFQPDASAPSIASRLPTPIHCSFAAQVRGNNWGGAAGGVIQQHAQQEDQNSQAFGNNVMVEPHHNTGMMSHDSVPRSLDCPAAAAQVMADWNMVQNRRLPSPISESGGEENSLESPGMILDSSGGHHSHLSHQHHLLATLPVRSNSAMELGQHSGSPGREHTPGAESPNGNAMDIEGPATPSPRKGHTRSKHTVNSWTALQPGMMRSFSIGYRADCEKCRLKVPGHFNHIIIS